MTDCTDTHRSCRTLFTYCLVVQLNQARAHLDQMKADEDSLETQVQRAKDRANELEEEARHAR